MTADISAVPSGARNATLADLAALLRDEQARKVDVVAPAAAIHARAGQLVLEDAAPALGPDGVTMTTGVYTPTDVCDSGIADKLGIPAAYLRRMREHKLTDITGQPASQPLDDCGSSPAARLPLLMLAPIAVAYEGEMSGDAVRRSTWRADRYSPCPRADAGRYLAFLASLGYQLSVIEQAVADGTPTPAIHRRRSPDRHRRQWPRRDQSRRRAAACRPVAPGRRARSRRRARDRPGDPHWRPGSRSSW